MTSEELKELFNRTVVHFGKAGKFNGMTSIDRRFYPMPDATKFEREVVEHYLIKRAGIKNLLNQRMPMGGREVLYEQRLEEILIKYGIIKP